MKRRVVVTGYGLVSPLGCGAEQVCNRVLEGLSGLNKLSADFPITELYKVNTVAQVPTESHNWNKECKAQLFFGKSKLSSRFIEFALTATEIAFHDSGIYNINDIIDQNRAGVAIGNGGIGSLQEIIEANNGLSASFKKLSPYFVPKALVNMAAGQVSIKHGLKGPVHSVATACAAGAHSIGDAYNFIRLGYADVMIAGGTDSSIDPLSLAGFARMKALGILEGNQDEDGDAGGRDSKENVNIQRTSRPFHNLRNGFVMGEGAGILVLEELSCAQRRGARIIAEICGYGLSGDAYHTTSPSLDGDGAVRSMQMAIKDAGLQPADIGYVNAHATSTPLGDAIEIEAIRKVFGNSSSSDGSSNRSDDHPLYVSSTKGATGHLLGAAGAVETIFTAWALHTGIMPPTLHLDEGQIDAQLSGQDIFHHIPNHALCYATGKPPSPQQQHDNNNLTNRINKNLVCDNINSTISDLKNMMLENKPELRYALKNSFGFGGTNASLVLGKYIP